MTEQVQDQEQRASLQEVVESLTGFDEIAIEQAFGAGIVTLLDTKATMATRALVFIQRKRDGMKDPEARKAAMEMRLGDVQDLFRDDDEQDDAEVPEPVTETGKDDGQPD